MKKSTKFSPEVRERAVRMVFEVRPEYSSQWAAIQAIAPKIGCTIYLLVGEHRVHISLGFDLLDHRHPHQSPGQNTIHRHQVAQPLGRVSSALQPDFSALKKLSMFQRSAYQSSFSTACCLDSIGRFVISFHDKGFRFSGGRLSWAYRTVN